MTHPRKIVTVRFWKEESGREPVKEWLKSLTKNQRRIMGADLKTVEMGWPLGMPLVKNIGKGIWEVRSNFRGGIARILFMTHKGNMVLLHAFIKKSQKTPAQDLNLAIKRAKTLR